MGINITEFIEGIDLIFNKWTALNLACENKWGGNKSMLKRQELKEMVQMFMCNTKNSTAKLADFLSQEMGKMFQVTLEDDSHIEVANLIVDLFEDLSKKRNNVLEKIKKIQNADLQNCQGITANHVADVQDDALPADDDDICSQSEASSDDGSESEDESESEDDSQSEDDSEGE